MLRAKNIIYGYCATLNPPKNKYLISLYRSDEIHIIAVFPTSRKRSGRSDPVHGWNKRDGRIVSYVFKANTTIGVCPDSGEDFSFPMDTTIPFDYCFREGDEHEILSSFENCSVVGVLSDEEYIDLIYALYKSPSTPKKYLPVFERILENEYSSLDAI